MVGVTETAVHQSRSVTQHIQKLERAAGIPHVRAMVARSGGGGGDDDAYNFDIADSYGGRGASKKKRTKQSKLGKSSLSKTTGSSPSSSPFKPHVSKENYSRRTAVVV